MSKVTSGLYLHFKGIKVKVLFTALHSETQEEMVVYVHLDDGQIWVRPVKVFLEKVEVNGKQVARFRKI